MLLGSMCGIEPTNSVWQLITTRRAPLAGTQRGLSAFVGISSLPTLCREGALPSSFRPEPGPRRPGAYPRPMTTFDIEAALDEIPAGTRVRLKLRDGKEVQAVAGDEHEVKAEDGGDVHLDLVEHVLVDASSADPE
jgi:hypothetical protein